MTTTRADFLAAIIAEPDDDDVRLVYADFLEEQGELERAEFIRCQIRANWLEQNCSNSIQQLSLDRDEYNSLRRRARELLEKCRDDWLCEVNWPIGVRDEWHRGFISELTATAADFLQHAHAILREHPVRRVRLTTMPQTCYLERWDDGWAYAPLCDEHGRGLARVVYGWNNPHRNPPDEWLFSEWLKRVYPAIEFELPESNFLHNNDFTEFSQDIPEGW